MESTHRHQRLSQFKITVLKSNVSEYHRGLRNIHILNIRNTSNKMDICTLIKYVASHAWLPQMSERALGLLSGLTRPEQFEGAWALKTEKIVYCHVQKVSEIPLKKCHKRHFFAGIIIVDGA